MPVTLTNACGVVQNNEKLYHNCLFDSSFCFFLKSKRVILHEKFESYLFMIQFLDMKYKKLVVLNLLT